MKRNSTIFFQVIIVLVGFATLTFMLWEPHLEGRNVGATLFEIYFKDPFLACAYIASILFFIALYQAFKLFGYIREKKTFSLNSIKALQIIRYSTTALVALIVAAEAYLFIVRPGDDIAGGVFMGLLAIVVCGVVAIAATRFEKTLQRGLNSAK